MILKLLNLTVILIMAFSFSSCNSKENEEKDILLIAHAGGKINNDCGTNSLEALQNAIAEGYHYIELDLCLTSDSILVAAHDWQTFNERTGYPLKKDTIPSLKDFKHRRILGKYTPITAEEIGYILEVHPEVHLVTDKVSDYKIINKYFLKYKKQLVIESFSFNDYQKLKEMGYYKVMYSDETRIDENKKTLQLLQYAVLPDWFSTTRINEIAIGRSFFNRKKNRFIIKHSDTRLNLYTINNLNDIPKDYINRIDMIYTDSIKPQESGKITILPASSTLK